MNLLRAVVRFVVALFWFGVEYVKLGFCDCREAECKKRRAAAILRDYFL